MNNYRLYREHKYVFYIFSEVLKLAAQTNFTDLDQVRTLEQEVQNLKLLLEGHAKYEEERIHALLKKRHCDLYNQAEASHQEHHNFFIEIENKFNEVKQAPNKENLGYAIYLDLRKFMQENLEHFDYEERILMPALQELYNEEEIRDIDAISYHQMTPNQVVHMIEVLFPHMNLDDKLHFLKDIRDSQPEKFLNILEEVSKLLNQEEKEFLSQMLEIKFPNF